MVFFSLLPYTTIFDAIGHSRKGAFCGRVVTEKRILNPTRSHRDVKTQSA